MEVPCPRLSNLKSGFLRTILIIRSAPSTERFSRREGIATGLLAHSSKSKVALTHLKCLSSF